MSRLDSFSRARSRRTPSVLVALFLAFALVAAACGGDDDDSSADADDTSTDGGTGSESGGSDLGSLTIGVGGTSPENAAPYLALAAGYYDEVGLDVTVNVDGANIGTNLASGRSDIIGSGIGSGLSIANQGRDTSIVYWWAGRGASAFLVGGEGVSSVDECKSVATFPEGTSAFGWAHLYNDVLDAGWDIQVSPDLPTQIASLRSEQYDCVITAIGPYLSTIDEGVASILIDPRDPATMPAELADFQVVEAALFGITDNLEAKHDEVVAFLGAMDKTRVLIEESTPEELASLLLDSDATKTDWAGYDHEELAKAFEESEQFIIPNEGQVPAELWDSEQLDFYVTAGLPFLDPADEKWSYDARVDMSFLDEALG